MADTVLQLETVNESRRDVMLDCMWPKPLEDI